MPGRATPEYPDTGKPKQEFTAVQLRAVFEERIQLEVRRLPCGSLGVVLSLTLRHNDTLRLAVTRAC
jgi:hypothetical protein